MRLEIFPGYSYCKFFMKPPGGLLNASTLERGPIGEGVLNKFLEIF